MVRNVTVQYDSITWAFHTAYRGEYLHFRYLNMWVIERLIPIWPDGSDSITPPLYKWSCMRAVLIVTLHDAKQRNAPGTTALSSDVYFVENQFRNSIYPLLQLQYLPSTRCNWWLAARKRCSSNFISYLMSWFQASLLALSFIPTLPKNTSPTFRQTPVNLRSPPWQSFNPPTPKKTWITEGSSSKHHQPPKMKTDKFLVHGSVCSSAMLRCKTWKVSRRAIRLWCKASPASADKKAA